MRISKNPHTLLNTNPSQLKLCRNFICAVRFDRRLFHSRKQCPFQLVAPFQFTIRSFTYDFHQNEIIFAE